jgi:oligopeptide/dipeptide ABC transporter ATP-binding protein
MSDRVTILYAGRVCETADVNTVFTEPRHPYTEALLTAIPRVETAKGDLAVIPGSIPNLIEPPTGCRFHPRCKYAKPYCKETIPPLVEVDRGHTHSCLRAEEISLSSPIKKVGN